MTVCFQVYHASLHLCHIYLRTIICFKEIPICQKKYNFHYHSSNNAPHGKFIIVNLRYSIYALAKVPVVINTGIYSVGIMHNVLRTFCGNYITKYAIKKICNIMQVTLFTLKRNTLPK